MLGRVGVAAQRVHAGWERMNALYAIGATGVSALPRRGLDTFTPPMRFLPRPLAPLLSCALLACGQGPSVQHPPASAQVPAQALAWHPTDLPNQDDNVHNDTLVIYTTHALGDGTFVMAAKNTADTRDGLHLVLYRPRPDSSAEVLAISAPAYDSWTMLPTFFTTGDPANGLVILANFGERQSWGQKVFWLKDQHFYDLGFIDVAERGWKTEDDSTFQWRTPIAARVQVTSANGAFTFSFMGDSIQLYDDQAGHQEVMLPAGSVQYRYSADTLRLLIDGAERVPKVPS